MDAILLRAAEILRSTPDRWTALAGQTEPALLHRPPAAGEWSAVECLQHLVEAERDVFPVRINRLLEGRDFEAFNPEPGGTAGALARDAQALASEFDRLRADSLRLLARLGPEDLERTALHAELGRVTLSELVHEWAAHDLMHTVQAERALMQPFIEGCGPWQEYFTDHRVGG